MSMGRMRDRQGELWVATEEIRTPGHPFFERLSRVLADHDFDRKVEALCGPYYADRDGRPSIPPGVYFRMVMVGYFEGIASERGLAWRCQDSLSLKSFLGLGPAEAAPDHSSLSVIRRRLPIEVFRAVQKLVLEMLKGAGLLKGRALAIDASTMEANAAMRSIVRRDTNESYAGYVARLAKAAGEPVPTRSARARFDRKRPKRTTSNKDWESPADPDAKIAKLKDGRTALAYKPEHVVDLDTGAIVAATVQNADLSDHATSTETLVQAIGNLDHLGQSSKDFTVVADKGYHSEAVIAGCVAAEIKTCISEPKLRGSRRLSRKPPLARKALDRNRRRVRSAYGKKLLRRRGETVERTFAHTLESGGMRRAWLRGRENVEKRYLVHVSACNLGLLMRRLVGFGTPKGLAGAPAALLAVLAGLCLALAGVWRRALRNLHLEWFTSEFHLAHPHRARLNRSPTSSTGW
jgi:transposase